ncbi:MAG: hypothetical protein JOZ10_18080 [Acidobacteria bacterium]|nr:hypothetical protein [Acidobacteriota bacterium]
MFTQAQIEVENKAVFDELKGAIENALRSRSEEFLHLLKRVGLRVRQFEVILHERIVEQLPGARTSRSCEELFQELSASDQGLLREFYLTAIEEVPVELRTKYSKLYRYEVGK